MSLCVSLCFCSSVCVFVCVFVPFFSPLSVCFYHPMHPLACCESSSSPGCACQKASESTINFIRGINKAE